MLIITWRNIIFKYMFFTNYYIMHEVYIVDCFVVVVVACNILCAVCYIFIWLSKYLLTFPNLVFEHDLEIVQFVVIVRYICIYYYWYSLILVFKCGSVFIDILILIYIYIYIYNDFVCSRNIINFWMTKQHVKYIGYNSLIFFQV